MNSSVQPGGSDPGGQLDWQEDSGSKVVADAGSDYLITVQVDPEYEGRVDIEKLHMLALEVLRAEKVRGPIELCVAVTSDAEVHALNKQYLGHDYDTDVISFGMSDDGETPEGAPGFVTPPERPPYLGDVVISYDRAAEQAPEFGQSASAEVAILLIHGVLHLLGYDDTSDAGRERMQTRQQELLEQLYLTTDDGRRTTDDGS